MPDAPDDTPPTTPGRPSRTVAATSSSPRRSASGSGARRSGGGSRSGRAASKGSTAKRSGSGAGAKGSAATGGGKASAKAGGTRTKAAKTKASGAAERSGGASGGGSGAKRSGTKARRGSPDRPARRGTGGASARTAEEVRDAAASAVARRASAARSRTAPARGARAGDHGAARTGLDVLLTDAAFQDGAGRFVQPRAAARVVGGLARRPDKVARRVAGLGAEVAKVVAGRSGIEPAKSDRRYRDRGWQENWALRRLMQTHLAAGHAVDGLVEDSGADWQSARLARFVAMNLLDALAPSNFPWSNPVVLRETIDRGGANFVDGGRRLAGDLWPPRLPASVDTSKFALGENLATTPGSVVLRHELFELIQYRPSTEQVHELPLLVVPPTINRYYIFDIAPGRSMLEHLVGEGRQQTFVMSWRNPGEEHAHWDFDAYAQAVLEAREAILEITGAETLNLNAACAGGMIASGLLAHLAHEDELDRFASLTLQVCGLDSARAGDTAAMSSRETAALAVAESARRGYLDGRQLAGVFAWMRPNDLIWGYVVNNYLLGKAPPAFDVLYWNQDAVRLSAGLHRDFMRMALDNQLAHAGEMTVLGSPVDLGAVDLDAYLVAASNDHIVPWQNAYRGVDLLGGTTRFVLSTSGHIQALVNPPGEESRSSFRVMDDPELAPDAFMEQAPKHQGSWWPDYVAWLGERAGELVDAPAELGSAEHPPLGDAPGTYVLED